EIDLLVLEDCVVEKPERANERRLENSYPQRKSSRTALWVPPATRQLREFAYLGAAILAALALWQLASNLPLTLGLGSMALVAALLSLLASRWLAPIFMTWMVLTFPISWTVSTLLLAIVYYVLV